MSTSDWKLTPVFRARWPVDTEYTEEQRAALCGWIRVHGLDPNETATVAVEVSAEDVSSGHLYAKVYALNQDGHRYLDLAGDLNTAAMNSVVVPLKAPPPFAGVPLAD